MSDESDSSSHYSCEFESLSEQDTGAENETTSETNGSTEQSYISYNPCMICVFLKLQIKHHFRIYSFPFKHILRPFKQSRSLPVA